MKTLTLTVLLSLTALQLAASELNAPATDAQKELTTAAASPQTTQTASADDKDDEATEKCFKNCPMDMLTGFDGHNPSCPIGDALKQQGKK